jgi:hypothetical protein
MVATCLPRERDSKKPNGNEYSWLLRALLVAMDRWVYDGIAPPPSAHPQLADKTLVQREEINFPALGKGNKQHSVAGALSRRRQSTTSDARELMLYPTRENHREISVPKFSVVLSCITSVAVSAPAFRLYREQLTTSML